MGLVGHFFYFKEKFKITKKKQSPPPPQAFSSTLKQYTDLSFVIAGHPKIRCCWRVRYCVRDEEGAGVDGADWAAVHLHPPVSPQCARGQGARREARPGDAPQRGLWGRRGYRWVRDVRENPDYINTFAIWSILYILYILLKISSLNKHVTENVFCYPHCILIHE